jgi:hypothetical protein
MPKTPKTPKKPTEIEFDYIKSNFFRVIRADGAWGGLSPSGAIHMAVYSERQAIPQKVIHRIKDGQLGPELTERRQTRKAIVREVEADIVFEIQQAMVLRDWLQDKIDQFQRLIGPLPVLPGSSPSSSPRKSPPKNANGKGKKK